jgi:hypothetical protein
MDEKGQWRRRTGTFAYVDTPVIRERHSVVMMTKKSYRFVGLAPSAARHPYGEARK